MLREGRPHEAAALLVPVAQDPGSGADQSATVQLALGRSMAMLGQIERGAQSIARACELEPGQASALTELSVLLGRLGRFGEALDRVREARKANPNLAAAAFQEAELLTDLRRDDEALVVVESFERALGAQAREPAAQARFLLIRARLASKKIDPRTLTGPMDALARDARVPPGLRCLLWTRLASLFDMIGRCAEAFEAQSRAKSLRRVTWDPAAHSAACEKSAEAWMNAGQTFAPVSGADASHLAFIVGLPRSGSTLLEQMLSRHPEAQPLGERNEVTRAANQIQRAAPGRIPIVTDLSGLNKAVLAELSREAMASYEFLREPGKRVLIDKQPFNYAQLPLMARILPSCRVIHAVRDPRDVCLSYYMQWFFAPHPQAERIEHLGQFCRDERVLMERWLSLPAPAQRPEVLAVRYEELVTDPERVMRSVLSFLGLAFDERVLDPAGSERIANTASRDQVRSPLYTSRTARWKLYECELAPIMPFAGPYCVD